MYEIGKSVENLVEDGTILLSPGEMLKVVQAHNIDFFAPLDEVVLRTSEDKEITCWCHNWSLGWRIFFWLRLKWHTMFI